MKAKNVGEYTHEHTVPKCECRACIYEEGIKEVVEFISGLIIGIDNCKFEERLDGDKGCIVLDMNENQWREKQKEWEAT